MLDLECTKSCADAAGAIFYSMMKLSLETPHSSPSKFFYCFGIHSGRGLLFLIWFQIEALYARKW